MELRTMIGIATFALLAAGCSSHADKDDTTVLTPHQSAMRSALDHSPPYASVTNADPATAVPEALIGKPSIAKARAAASAERTRLGGEQFALEACRILYDVSIGESGADVLEAVASPHLDPGIRRFLVADIDVQQMMGSPRAVDISLPEWIRSHVVGDKFRPDRLNVEIALDSGLASEGFDWFAHSCDVAWEHGRWWLVGYAYADFDPNPDKNTSIATVAKILTGHGWRRIPPHAN